jgi:tetratricopeptide (TPR) repeat protein
MAGAVLESNQWERHASSSTLEEAEAVMAEAIEISDRSLYTHYSIMDRAFLGWLRVIQGQRDEARRLLAEARQKAAEELAGAEDEGWLHWLQARVSGAEGRWTEALAAHEAAAELCARYGLRWHWARFHLEWAEAHVARGEPGDRERAVELIREAHAAFEEMGIPRYVALARDRLQELQASEEPAT